MTAALDAFVQRHTRIMRAALVPEVALHLARDATGIFVAADRFERAGERLQPFWAFAWPGGQALARYLLDHPGCVQGRRILDIGAGSGIAAIAAARGGAAAALAADIDPLAAASTALNAAANGVAVATTTDDVLGDPPAADLILVADLVYEPSLATRVAAFIERAAAARAHVLLADRTDARRPPGDFDLIATFTAPLTPALPGFTCETARLWQLRPRRHSGKRSR